MRVLVTGGGGYIGSVLVGELLAGGHEVTVLDRLYFGASALEPVARDPRLTVVRADVRTVERAVVEGQDAVVDLAALSNDPSADLDPALSHAINHDAPLRLARLARDVGVSRYVFSSSCSVYGSGDPSALLDETAELRPVSLYAKLKVDTERELLGLGAAGFAVTALRNATAYGVSPRMRFDLVVNMMTLYALRRRRIFVLGGGEQWRPLVHVRDIARAFALALGADAGTVGGQVLNVGSNEQNLRARSIAKLVASVVPNTEIESVPDDPDKRTYRVDFSKIGRVLGFSASRTVADGAREILAGLEAGEIDEGPRTKTVAYYNHLLEAERLVKELSIDGRML